MKVFGTTRYVLLTLLIGGVCVITSAGEKPNLAPPTQPVRLFGLVYGKGLNQIGVEEPELGTNPDFGPSDFLVGYDGNIYIGDPKSRRVKVFSRSGRLLAVSEEIDRIEGMGVDLKGRVFVIGGAALNKVTVLQKSAQGSQTTFVVQQSLLNSLKEKIQKLMVSPLRGRQLLSQFTCSKEGNIFLLGSEEVWIFDEQGQLRGRVPGRCALVDPRGRLFFVEVQRGQDQVFLTGKDETGKVVNRVAVQRVEAVEVTIRDSSGEVLKKVTVKPPQLRHAQGELHSPNLIAVDGRGHLYFHASPTTVVAKTIAPKLRVGGPDFVLEYDENGDFKAVRASFYFGPIPYQCIFRVDEAGNVYWLDFKADHVDVMMAPVP